MPENIFLILNFFFHLDDTNKYNCTRCGRKYKYRGSFMRHVRYECGVKFGFTCSLCPKQFKRKDVLKLHSASVHGVIF